MFMQLFDFLDNELQLNNNKQSKPDELEIRRARVEQERQKRIKDEIKRTKQIQKDEQRRQELLRKEQQELLRKEQQEQQEQQEQREKDKQRRQELLRKEQQEQREQREEEERRKMNMEKIRRRKQREEQIEKERKEKEKNNIMNSNAPENLRTYTLMNLRQTQNYGMNINTAQIKNILAKYTELFAHYVTGKTVAIIGPANSVVGTGRGSLIDKFDIIIRLNKALPIPTNLAKDIGSRTDVIYNALNTTDYPGQNNLDTSFYKQNGVKFVVSPYPLSNVFYGDIMNYINRYQFDIPFRTVSNRKYTAFANQIKTRPYTGTSAIMDILSFNVKALYITGIDFYNTPYYSQYRRVKKSKLLNLRENSIHVAYPQMEYLLYKSLIDKRILLDNTLE